MTVHDLMFLWLTEYQRKVTVSTYSRIERVCRNQIDPTLGSSYVCFVSAKKINEVLLSYANTATLSHNGLVRMFSVLQRIFAHAVSIGLRTDNPCGCISAPREFMCKRKRRCPRMLSDADVNALYREAFSTYASSGDYKNYVGIASLLILETGLRVEELQALTWDAVDDSAALLKCYKRSIPISPKARTCFEALHLYNPQSKYVCTTKTNNPVTISNLRRSFQRLLKQAGITASINLHDLRYTYGARLLCHGTPVDVVCSLMGHSRVQVTRETYKSLLQSLQER